MTQLAATVYVTDPDTHQTVTLAQGTNPEPRLAALVTNPAAWVDGKLPRPPRAKAASNPDTADSPDGNVPATGDDTTATDTPAAKRTAASKTAATKPARGRTAADEGTSGD